MTAFVLAVTRRISPADLEELTLLLIVSGAGLLISLLAISCGLDIGHDF